MDPFGTEFDANVKINNKHQMTKGQLLLIFVIMCLKHSLSSKAMGDFLHLFNMLIPGCLPNTRYFMDKLFFNHASCDRVLHFFCPDCKKYLGESKEKQMECIYCERLWDMKYLRNNFSYLVVLSIEEQIREILERVSLEKYRDETTDISDITTGDEYRKCRMSMGTNDISLTINSDGVPVFKSSRFSVWPVFASINELPYNMRKSNIILQCLWFHATKPVADTLFKVLVESIRKINVSGLHWMKNGVPTVSSLKIVTCVCDASARAMFQKMKQFNGLYGCGFCLHKGEPIQKGQGNVVVYPPDVG